MTDARKPSDSKAAEVEKVQKPSITLGPSFEASRQLKQGFNLLMAACAKEEKDNGFAGQFIDFIKHVGTGKLGIEIYFRCDGTIVNYPKAPLPPGVTVGVAAHTTYALRQSDGTKNLAIEADIDKTKAQYLVADVNFAADFKNPFQAAWCIAHELTVHVMPFWKQQQAVLAAINKLGVASGSAAAAGSEPVISELQALLSSPALSDAGQHISQVKLENMDYLQAWKQMVLYAKTKYPDHVQKINDAFEVDIVSYYKKFCGNSSPSVMAQDQQRLAEVMKAMSGESALSLGAAAAKK